MYKVFIEEKAFYLTFNVSKELINPKYEIINVYGGDKDHFKGLLKGENKIINFESHKKLKKQIKHNFQIISAAGGLVVNEKNEILMIYRNDCWDLPKGKIEKGEKKKQAAIREVEEECGIKNLTIEKALKVTYHTYSYKQKEVFKQSFWYLMNYKGDEKLIPQLEEGITKVEWVSIEDLPNKLNNTYGNIKDVIEAYLS